MKKGYKGIILEMLALFGRWSSLDEMQVFCSFIKKIICSSHGIIYIYNMVMEQKSPFDVLNRLFSERICIFEVLK